MDLCASLKSCPHMAYQTSKDNVTVLQKLYLSGFRWLCCSTLAHVACGSERKIHIAALRTCPIPIPTRTYQQSTFLMVYETDQ